MHKLHSRLLRHWAEGGRPVIIRDNCNFCKAFLQIEDGLQEADNRITETQHKGPKRRYYATASDYSHLTLLLSLHGSASLSAYINLSPSACLSMPTYSAFLPLPSCFSL